MNKQNYRDYFDSYIKSIKSDIEKLKSNYPSDFDKVVNLIIKSKGRLVFSGIGKSGQVAKKISSSIASTGTPSFFVHPSEAVHGDLGMIQKDDIVFAISNSGNTKELFGIIDYCKNQNIKLVSITSNPDSHLAKNSNYNLFIPKIDEFSHLGSPCNSIILTLIIGDALMIALHNEKKFSRDEYKLFHPSGSLGRSMVSVRDVMIKDIAILNFDVINGGSNKIKSNANIKESDKLIINHNVNHNKNIDHVYNNKSIATNILILIAEKKLDFCVITDSCKRLIGIIEVTKIKQILEKTTEENSVSGTNEFIELNDDTKDVAECIIEDIIYTDVLTVKEDDFVSEIINNRLPNYNSANANNIVVLDCRGYVVGVVDPNKIL